MLVKYCLITYQIDFAIVYNYIAIWLNAYFNNLHIWFFQNICIKAQFPDNLILFTANHFKKLSNTKVGKNY